MVGVVTVHMFDDVTTRWCSVLLPSGVVVSLVVFKTHIVEAAMVAPQVGNDIADGHERGLTAGVNIGARFRVVEDVEPEGVLQVN